MGAITNLAHKIRLKPTIRQQRYFVQACGVARFTYNWGLTEWVRQRNAGTKPNLYGVKKALNEVKHELFPWMSEVTKFAAEYGIVNLGQAFSNFFSPKLPAKHPCFKKKGKACYSFVASANVGQCKVNGRKVWVPKLGWVKMCETLRFSGDITRITISRHANHWYAAISVRMPRSIPERESQAVGGLDVGIEPLVVESDGTRHENPRARRSLKKRLNRWKRRKARRTEGSRGWREALRHERRLEKKIADIRGDAHHKVSSKVVSKYTILGIESLRVKGLLKNKRISGSLSDAALSGLLTKVVYKAQLYGTTIVKANTFFPSSKLCNVCGAKNCALKMEKIWHCKCGVTHDRDLNAALNLKAMASSAISNAAGQFGSGQVVVTPV